MRIDIELKNSDCFDYIKTIENESVSLALLDPPYDISRDTNFAEGGVDKFKVSMDFGKWDKDFEGLDKIIEECYRVLKKGGTLICFYDLWKITDLREYFESVGFKQIRFIEWVKTNPVPLNSKTNYLTNAREAAVVGVKEGNPVFYSEYDNGIYEYPICHAKDRFHPTQKPVELLEDIILKHSNEEDIIFDCFAGSGSTAVAAWNTNRNFKGCELSEYYYRKAMERLILISAVTSF